ncbi:MAG: hypothetical protein WCW36_03600 [Candidatus Paceibacterota bacterium]|jgi:hypothetical protein
MTTDQDTTNIQTAQELGGELDVLVEEAKGIIQEIEDANKESSVTMDALDASTDVAVADIEKSLAELDQIEKESGDELDKLMLEEAEDLASEVE